MRIKLLVDLPVDPKHGALAGTEHETLPRAAQRGRGAVRWWIRGAIGWPVGVKATEAEIIQEVDHGNG